MYTKVVIEITPEGYTKTLYNDDGTVAESIATIQNNCLLTSDKPWDDVFWDKETDSIKPDCEALCEALDDNDIIGIHMALQELYYL
ncbi:hypothetical protein [uncultured Megasphaera sp.]|uniref:hypothetical protein n=1 Tax=uncultured Megasphaera sp. TaxID=165188 RepID=UPI0025EF8172|nr:hypothetical protein [uncultured Megasphaera sp.]